MGKHCPNCTRLLLRKQSGLSSAFINLWPGVWLNRVNQNFVFFSFVSMCAARSGWNKNRRAGNVRMSQTVFADRRTQQHRGKDRRVGVATRVRDVHLYGKYCCGYHHRRASNITWNGKWKHSNNFRVRSAVGSSARPSDVRRSIASSPRGNLANAARPARVSAIINFTLLHDYSIEIGSAQYNVTMICRAM